MENDRQQRLGWSIARLIRDGYGAVSLRKGVLADPVLTGTTLADILESPDGLRGFIAKCDTVPGCGDVQREAIAAAIVTELEEQARIATADPGDQAALARSRLATAVASDVDDRFSAAILIGRVHPAPDGLETLCRRLWRQDPARHFCYMPMGIPDCAKTPAVFAADAGHAMPGDKDMVGWPLAEDAGADGLRASRGVIMIDGQVLAALRARCGRYAGLSPEDVAAQIERLLWFSKALPEGTEAVVTDFAVANLTPGAVLGNRVILPGPDGFSEFNAPAILARMRARCEAARRTALALGEVLDQELV